MLIHSPNLLLDDFHAYELERRSALMGVASNKGAGRGFPDQRCCRCACNSLVTRKPQIRNGGQVSRQIAARCARGNSGIDQGGATRPTYPTLLPALALRILERANHSRAGRHQLRLLDSVHSTSLRSIKQSSRPGGHDRLIKFENGFLVFLWPVNLGKAAGVPHSQSMGVHCSR